MTTTIPTDAPQDRGSEQNIEQKAIAGISQGALVRRRFVRHKFAMIALVVLGLVILLAFTSVGTVVGGSGDLKALPDGTLAIDGFRPMVRASARQGAFWFVVVAAFGIAATTAAARNDT